MAGKAPAGAVVHLYYDSDELVARDEYIRTRTGRTYRVLGGRIQQRGKHRGRQHLACVVFDDEVPPEAKVHPLKWYSRDPKSR